MPQTTSQNCHFCKAASPFAIYTYISLVAALFAVGFVDQPLALMFRAHKYEDFGGYRLWFSAFEQFGNSALYLVPAGIIVLAYWIQKRWQLIGETVNTFIQRWYSAALLLFLSVGAGGLLVNLLKILFGRSRPRLLFREEYFGFFWLETDYNHFAFPSGHTHTAVAAVSVLWVLFPKLGPWLIPIGGLTAMNRVILGSHYLADVIAGAWVAVAFTLWLHQKMRNAHQRW